MDRLEQRGHVTRGPRPGDRRSVLITLTASGGEAATGVTEAISRLERRALDGLPRQAVEGFHRISSASPPSAGM